MVFKKPYAFLIKNFKLIHLILTAIYIYLAFKVSGMLTYYNNYISGAVGKLVAINYINSNYQIAIVLSIIICTIILILMQHKKKPKLFYIILILLYILISTIISISVGGLETIYFSILDSKTMRLYRDLLSITLVVQYITIATTLIRGLGFDIKKFDFVKDLNDMNIELTDDEEVELTLNNTNTIFRKIRRKIRELKYYYIENKSFITIIAIIVIILLASTITIDTQVINKVYNENEVFTTDAFDFQVLNTYITKKSFNGKVLSNNSSYLILKLQINQRAQEQKLNNSNLIIKAGNKSYTYNNKYYAKFEDLGISYKNQKIKNSNTYLFIYDLPDASLNKKITFIYAGEKTVKLSPIDLDKTDSVTNLKLTDNIDLSQTVLSTGTININSYEINSQYSYQYSYQIDGQEHTLKRNIISASNTILKLNITSSLSNNLDVYNIISNYGKLKYVLDKNEYTSNILVNKTPNNYKEGLYLEIDKNVEQAESIYLELNIRNKKYIYTLK